MRVHELAKELGRPSKDLISEIEALGGAVKNHMSLMDDKIIERLRQGGNSGAHRSTRRFRRGSGPSTYEERE